MCIPPWYSAPIRKLSNMDARSGLNLEFGMPLSNLERCGEVVSFENLFIHRIHRDSHVFDDHFYTHISLRGHALDFHRRLTSSKCTSTPWLVVFPTLAAACSSHSPFVAMHSCDVHYSFPAFSAGPLRLCTVFPANNMPHSSCRPRLRIRPVFAGKGRRSG